MPQESVLGPFLFLAYVTDIWRNIKFAIRQFADDCTMNRKIMNSNATDNLQKELTRLGEWAGKKEMTINPGKVQQ